MTCQRTLKAQRNRQDPDSTSWLEQRDTTIKIRQPVCALHRISAVQCATCNGTNMPFNLLTYYVQKMQQIVLQWRNKFQSKFSVMTYLLTSRTLPQKARHG